MTLTERLEDYIRFKRNDEAKSLLRQLLRLQSKPSGNFDDTLNRLGQLLIHSTVTNNGEMVQHLIELGADVDHLDADYENSLMLAVTFSYVKTVKVLLKAKANLDAVSPGGLTVLQMIFDLSPLILFDGEVSELVLRRVQAETNDIEELVGKLMAAGCTLYHAPFLRDLQAIECMLDRGLDINSKCTSQKRTALHAAAELRDSNLVNWLLDRGADVDALDGKRDSPLFIAATHGCKVVMKILLERGADPNVSNRLGQTAFSEIFLAANNQNADCLEILFHYGALPQNVFIDSYLYPILEIAFAVEIYGKIDLLFDYLAVLKLRGKPEAESFLRYNEDIRNFAVVQRRLELREENLKCKRFGKLSMLELLTDSERKMRVHARNNDLVSELQDFCLSDVNKKMFPYYCKTLAKRMSKVMRLVKLENAAIPTVCEIINGNYNECYVPARNIVGYLNESDLKLFGSV